MKKQITQLSNFLEHVDVVKLDSSGVFKYILIDIVDKRTQDKLTLVRGAFIRNQELRVSSRQPGQISARTEVEGGELR